MAKTKKRKKILLAWFLKGENEKLDAMSPDQIKERIRREAGRNLSLDDINVREDCVDVAYRAYDEEEQTLGEAADILEIDSRYWHGFPL